MEDKVKYKNKSLLKTEIIISIITIFLLFLIFVVRYFVVTYNKVPQIELLGERTMNLKINEKFDDPGVKASIDDKDASKHVEVEGKVDTSKVGNYELIYTIKNDKNGKQRSVKRTIIILDNVKPVINLKGNAEYFVGVGSKYTDPGYSAKDNVDGDLTDKIQIESNVNTKQMGSYEVKYKVKDSSGNETETIRIVRVVDLDKPIINLFGKSTMYLELKQKYNEPGFKAIDDIDGDLTEQVSVSGSVDSNTVGVYYIKYSVKDKNNNLSVKTRTIYVGNQDDVDKGTNIQVSIAKQQVWFYKNGKLIVTSPTVTGHRNKHDTPKGTFRILSKTRNTYLTGRDYRSFVNYWMPINSRGVGLHDATWRNTFGGSIYTYNGSHGCINLPFNVAKIIYENATVGTKVTVS